MNYGPAQMADGYTFYDDGSVKFNPDGAEAVKLMLLVR